MNKTEKAIKYLLEVRPFYAHFFLNCKVEFDNPNVPTAAASIQKGAPVLYFNMKFMESFEPKVVAGIVEHEILHLLFEHVIQFQENYEMTRENQYISNIAMDCAINQYIEHLPPNCVTPESLEAELKVLLERFQTWEYYYVHLKDHVEKLKAAGTGTLDEHGTPMDEKMSSDQAQAVLKATADKATEASNGNVPEHVQKIISSLSKMNQMNWKQVLRLFVSKSTSNTTKATRKKLNRRFGLDMPGKNKKRELTLGVCVDSSGSVSDQSYEQFMAEIVDISKNTLKTYLVDADCTVQNVTTINKGKKFDIARHGHGGTAYQPAIDECMKLKCDAIIYFGDFDTSDQPQNPGVPFLWVGVGNQPKPGNFGAELRLK